MTMERHECFYGALLDSIAVGIMVVDEERRINYWSRGAERLTGYGSRELLGQRCCEAPVAHLDCEGALLCTRTCPHSLLLECSMPLQTEAFVRHKEGHLLSVVTQASAVHDGAGKRVGALEMLREHVQPDQLQQRLCQLEYLSARDELTGVANRRTLTHELEARIDAYRGSGFGFGVLFIDVDHFKDVNDTHGHAAGDRALQVVAHTLANSSRSFDVVGRYGGEEFVVIVSNTTTSSLGQTAERLRSQVEAAAKSMSTGTPVTVSIGGVLALLNDSTASLLARADDKLFTAKRQGRNRVCV